MEGGQGQMEEPAWNQSAYQHTAPSYRMSDIITVLSGLREEVDVLEGEIQKVEAELLSNSENKVLNRKFERLTEEKRNKEGRRERLELQLTQQPDLYPSNPQTTQGLLPAGPELHVPQQHSYQYLPQPGVKRQREDEQSEYQHQNPNMQEYMQVMPDGVTQLHPGGHKKGRGRGGKGGQKFCKRCKERITYGHQQKCRFCRNCYEDTKVLVLRTECPHGHDNSAPSSEPPVMISGNPLDQHQAALEAQQAQHLQLQQAQQQILDSDQPRLPGPGHQLQHHLALSHQMQSRQPSEGEPGVLQEAHHLAHLHASSEALQSGPSLQQTTQPQHSQDATQPAEQSEQNHVASPDSTFV